MKIKCNREMLSDALNKVSRAVAIRSTMAALEGIYLRTEESSLYLCGYNLELGISTKILANVYEEGSIVLSSKLFCEIVRKMPGDELEIKSTENLITTISSSESEYSIIGMSAADFPELAKGRLVTLGGGWRIVVSARVDPAAATLVVGLTAELEKCRATYRRPGTKLS